MNPMLSPTQRLKPAETPVVILADGCFGESKAKLALGVIRYGQWPVAAVWDASQAGKTVREVTGLPCDAPVVASLEEAMRFGPKALMIGTAPSGGWMPAEWKPYLLSALENGLHLISGLHSFLTEDADLVAAARQKDLILWDVRDPEIYGRNKFKVISHLKPRPANAPVITMVGTDCSVGKMHTALELHKAALGQGQSAAFVATGQIGILIAGRGVPLDRVIGDFMAGALEVCVHEAIAERQAAQPNAQSHWIIVEGQGSLGHPAYSGVTLSLVHGSNPDMMILCHKAGLTSIRNYPLPLQSIPEIIARYEAAAAWIRPDNSRPARVVGISVNTSEWPEDRAKAYLAQLENETGLPATDPVRYGVASLLEAIRQEEHRLGPLV